MYEQFQISASAFLQAQLQTAQAQKICSPAPVAIGNYQIVLDHLEFGPPSLRHPFYVQVALPVTAYLADQNDILAHPDQPPAMMLAVPVVVVLNLSYGVDESGSGNCILAVQFDSLEMGAIPALPPGISAAAIQQIASGLAQSLYPPTQTAMNIAGSFTVTNAGLSADSTLSRLSFMVEFADENPYAPQLWASFFAGNVPDYLAGHDWCFFMDQNVVGNMVQTLVELGIEEHGNASLQVVTGYGYSYSNPSPDEAQVVVSFGGNIDAGICTVYTDITATATITCPAANTLTAEVNIGWNPHSTACTLTIGAIGAAIGLVTDIIEPALSQIINPITTFLLGVGTALIIESAVSPPSQSLPHCHEISPTHYTCSQQPPLPSGTEFGNLQFTSLTAFPGGAAVQGSLAVTPLTPPVLDISTNAFVYFPLIPQCADFPPDYLELFVANPDEYVAIQGWGEIDNGGTAPLFLCGAPTVVNDPLGVFQNLVRTSGTQAPISFWITVPPPRDTAYLQHPYPCQLLFSTNAGIRLVTIPPPPPLLIDGLIAVFADEIRQQQARCEGLIGRFFGGRPVPLNRPGHRPDGLRVDHFWDIEVSGLPSGETARLLGADGETLMSAISAGNPVSLSAIVPPVATGPEASLVRGDGKGDGSSSGSAQSVTAQSTALIRRSQIWLPARAHDIGICFLGGRRCLFTVGDDLLQVYDVTVPSAPALKRSWTIGGLRGALSLGRTVVTFGADGLTTLAPPAARLLPPDCARPPWMRDDRGVRDDRGMREDRGLREAHGVRDAVAGRGVIYAAAGDALEVRSRSLELVTSVDAPGITALARIGDTLVGCDGESLLLFDVTRPLNPVRQPAAYQLAATDLALPVGGAGRTVLAVSRAGSASVLDIGQPDSIQVVSEFPRAPWFYQLVQWPGFLARLAGEGTSVVISEWEESSLAGRR